MHDIEEIILKPMIGRSSKKFWYTVSAFSLLWLSLFYFHFSDLKNHNSQISLLKNNFIDTYESNSVLENGISIEKGIKSTRDDDKESQAGNPIDNFFIGGDWDKYLDEASKIKKKLKKPKLDNQIHLTKNEAKSINDVFGRGNVQESRNLDSVSVEKEKMKEEIKIQPRSAYGEGVESDAESCSGRYIYMHELPSQFNEDLLKHCGLLSEWTNMCIFVSNFGFGQRISNSTVLSKTGWFETNQFMLEVIFHNRMKEYRCLTNDSSRASAIFVPYYSGLDVARFLWDSHSPTKDYNPASLVKWLREKPEWKKLWGRDHFMVAGRVSWDFRRPTNETSDWGNRLMVLPESKNMTFLTIESSPWNENDFAIPYPSYFHPSTDNQIYTWQNRMKRIRRQYLFSFAGAPRPKLDTIRREIIEQCKATRRRCKMLKECDTKGKKCYNPVYVMQTFQNSIFCLQPPGDSYTRRSTFDSILAGCIPVFFHPGSAYVQYLWHLPKDYTKYSVFIPENEVKNGKASIEKILSKIPKAKRLAMREQVIKLIPGIVYTDPTSSLETLEDAFDITIDGVLERFEQIRNDTRNGKNLTLINQQEEFTWKKNLFGTVKKHEWDPFFKRSF